MNAFVLAGGRSTRMSRDKALLDLCGRPLIEHALGKLRSLGFATQIAGSRPDLASYAPILSDNYPNSGPLGGIEAALASSNTEQNLFVPVDLPWLPVKFLCWMMERASQTNALATIPRLQGRPQPLCAVYSRAFLPHVQSALAAGQAKVMYVVELVANVTGQHIDSFDTETIAAAQFWEQVIPLHRWFENINTPADFEKAALEQSAHIY